MEALTQEQRQVVQQVMGVDPASLVGLDWTEILAKFKAAMLLLQELLNRLNPPQPVIAASTHNDCCHVDLCRQTLESQLCALHCALHHYECCCKE